MESENTPEEHDLTQTHFDAFSGFVAEWQSRLGLIDWKIGLCFSDCKTTPELEGNQATVYMKRNAMVATIYLNTKWGSEPPTERNLRRTALHEVLEVLLCPLTILAETRFNVDSDDVEYETHRVIRVLEHVLSERGVLKK